ncbi:MAG: PilZ domain-containing protein [Planctomycetota bacterium]|jgi:hypothetical protein
MFEQNHPEAETDYADASIHLPIVNMPNPMIHATLAPEPPAELVSFVERQIREAQLYDGVERRSERRHLVAVPVLVQPVDAEFNATGAPFAAVTRDISLTGVGLVHGEPIDPQLLALRMCLAEEEVKLVVEVLSCRALGPYHYVGCKPVSKLESFPREPAEHALP